MKPIMHPCPSRSWKPLLKTVTDGKLTVATSPDFAPYEFYSIDENDNPTLVGFDIALAQYIADYLGLELEIIPMDFDGTLSELSAKKVDLALSGYSPDPAREDKMDFSDIYYVGGQSFVTVQDKADSFSALAEANKAEYQIGAQLGSIQADLAKENTPDADIVELSKVTDIIAELLSGKLDGAFIETVVAEAYAKNYPALCVKFAVPYEQEGLRRRCEQGQWRTAGSRESRHCRRQGGRLHGQVRRRGQHARRGQYLRRSAG